MAYGNAFWRNFNEGWGAAERIVDAYNQAKLSEKLRGIERDTPTRQYTEEQGEYLQNVANATDENGNPYYKIEYTNGGYQITPNRSNAAWSGASDLGSPLTVAANKYNYLGKLYDTAPTEAQMRDAKMQAAENALLQYGGTWQDVLNMRRGLMQDYINKLKATEAEQALADREQMRQSDQAAAAYQGYLADTLAAKNSGAIRDASDRIRAMAAARDITPEQAEESLAAIQKYYNPQTVTQLAGAEVAKGRGPAAGLQYQNLLDNVVRNAIYTHVAKYVTNGDLNGLADWFTKYYDDGRAYKYAGKDKNGNAVIEAYGPDGKLIDRQAVEPEALPIMVATLADPTKLVDWSKWKLADKRAQQQFAAQMARLDSLERREDARMAAQERKPHWPLYNPDGSIAGYITYGGTAVDMRGNPIPAEQTANLSTTLPKARTASLPPSLVAKYFSDEYADIESDPKTSKLSKEEKLQLAAERVRNKLTYLQRALGGNDAAFTSNEDLNSVASAMKAALAQANAGKPLVRNENSVDYGVGGLMQDNLNELGVAGKEAASAVWDNVVIPLFFPYRREQQRREKELKERGAN